MRVPTRAGASGSGLLHGPCMSLRPASSPLLLVSHCSGWHAPQHVVSKWRWRLSEGLPAGAWNGPCSSRLTAPYPGMAPPFDQRQS